MDFSQEDEGGRRGFGQGVDLRFDLDQLERELAELRVLYEQYFSGVLPLAPEKQHQLLKQHFRKLRKAPFKTAALGFKLRSLEQRYSTMFTYWQRVLREKEDGVYSKDVFKANLRDKLEQEEAYAATKQGAADRGVRSLFTSYQEALERAAGKKVAITFDSFKETLSKRAKDLKAQHGVAKLSFRVVVKDGKVSIQAKAKRST
jgi:hypothetical protein